MAKTKLNELTDLALEVYALSVAARGCVDYESSIRIAGALKAIGEKLVKLSPEVFDEMTENVLRRLMERKFPEVAPNDIRQIVQESSARAASVAIEDEDGAA